MTIFPQRRRADHGGDRRDDPFEVLVGHAELEDVAIIVLVAWTGSRRLGGFMLRMMTLVAPSEAIWRWASRLAPSAIASIAITDDDAEDQPEDGQENAQLVQREVAHRQQDGDVEAVHDETFRDWGLWA